MCVIVPGVFLYVILVAAAVGTCACVSAIGLLLRHRYKHTRQHQQQRHLPAPTTQDIPMNENTYQGLTGRLEANFTPGIYSSLETEENEQNTNTDNLCHPAFRPLPHRPISMPPPGGPQYSHAD